jgi:heterodisulfide reductase subunit B
MLYNYYPGCTLSTKAKALDQAARACAAKLGFPLVELPEWQCCGAVYPLAPDAIAERLGAARALISARDKGGVLVTLCSACHHVLKRGERRPGPATRKSGTRLMPIWKSRSPIRARPRCCTF